MTDEDWLRAGLADAVPDPPGAPDRAASALARARRARRRTTIVGGAGVALTLAVVGAIATLGDGQSPDRAADEPPSPFDVAACPAEPVDALTQVGPDHVPDGAVSVRLCDGGAVSIDVPQDALVTDVDEVAAAINELEIADPGRMCTADLGPGYQLVFDFADGTSVVAAGQLYSCRDVITNGVERTGADVPLERFIELLRKQREDLEPPAPVDTSGIDCASTAGTTSAPTVGRPEDLVVASYCYEFDYEQWSEVEIPTEDLQVLVADLTGRTDGERASISCAIGDAPATKIVGVSAWADAVQFGTACDDLNRLEMAGATWSPASLDIVQRLYTEALRRR